MRNSIWRLLRSLLRITEPQMALLDAKRARERFCAACSECGSDVSLTTIYPENYNNIKIGTNVVLNDAFLDSHGPVTIGDSVFFGWNVKVLTGMHDIHKYGLERQRAVESRPVVIEDGAWVASFAILLPGSFIGRHAVVAAGSVVHGRVEPFTVVGGNPARAIRKIEPNG